MSWLKTLPIAYRGRLEDVRVVNFSVRKEELEPLMPESIPVFLREGRAIISLADLEIRNMRPKPFPSRLSLSYRHVALRVLIDNPGQTKGIYFLRSFCSKPCLVCGSGLFTDYQLCRALISGKDHFHLQKGKEFLRYQLGQRLEHRIDESLQNTASLNTAYAVHKGILWQTKIKPATWPLEPIECNGFATNLFQSARLEAAYVVKGNLEFERSRPLPWKSPKEGAFACFGSNTPLFDSSLTITPARVSSRGPEPEGSSIPRSYTLRVSVRDPEHGDSLN